jgi:hypothetical protein
MSKQTAIWAGVSPELRGPWLGQEGPTDEPAEFCPEVLTVGRRVCGITFSPAGNEAFFNEYTPDGKSSGLMWMRAADGVWTRPEAAPFNSAEIDNDIVWSPDGERLVWRSWRPLPGKTEPEENLSLWAVDRSGDGWGKPFPIECGGVRQSPAYSGIASNGSLYFATRFAEGKYGIARALRDGKQYAEPEIVLSETFPAGDACVAPDETFLIGTCFRLPQYNGTGSLMVSFRTPDGGWSQLQDLGPEINTDLVEYCPTISADGKHLFFCRIDRENRTVPARTYWIDTGFIAMLRGAL